MKKQQYSNHAKSYPLHHFVFYPLLGVAAIWSGMNIRKHPDDADLWLAITIVFLLMGLLSFMMRQHYGLMMQDRVIRVELRLRYFQLTQKRLEEMESKLSLAQLVALRFASDEELPQLLRWAADENISASEIKKAVKNWQPDYDRV